MKTNMICFLSYVECRHKTEKNDMNFKRKQYWVSDPAGEWKQRIFWGESNWSTLVAFMELSQCDSFFQLVYVKKERKNKTNRLWNQDTHNSYNLILLKFGGTISHVPKL
jgi:hypothetical protein